MSISLRFTKTKKKIFKRKPSRKPSMAQQVNIRVDELLNMPVEEFNSVLLNEKPKLIDILAFNKLNKQYGFIDDAIKLKKEIDGTEN